jgi:hypothetical protein
MESISLMGESRLSLSKAAQELNVDLSTIWRWCIKGVRSVKLESFSIGAKRFTTEEAVERFIEATTRAANGETVNKSPRSSRRQQHDISEAEKYLESENC